MSQGEVLEVLEKFKRPMAGIEIAKVLNSNVEHLAHSIKRLIKYHEIKIIEIHRDEAMKRFHCKRRMRLYYI